jgi:hypothetical protein
MRFGRLLRAGAATLLGAAAAAQDLNIDFGSGTSAPPATYGAAGQPGVWNEIPAAHGTTTPGLVDLSGAVTAVSVSQIGGLALLDDNDPAVTGDHALLLDDFLVTYNDGLESCLYLNALAAGTYEVLIYARMPDPAVLSYTSVDQEPGFPHWSVGGAWPGHHGLLVSYSRHVAVVSAAGDLDLHSGIVPGADEQLGAALNGLQVRRIDLFRDGFESQDFSGWDHCVGDGC